MGCIQSTAAAKDGAARGRALSGDSNGADEVARRRRSSDAGLAPDATNVADLQRGLGASQVYPGRAPKQAAGAGSIFDLFDDMERPDAEEVVPVDRNGIPVMEVPMGQGHRVRGVAYGVCQIRGRREYQEDRFQCTWDEDLGHSFFAVYDGHGGARTAMFLSKLLHRALFEGLAKRPSAPVADTIRTIWEQFDEGLLHRVDDCSGATAAVLAVFDQALWLANLGDSRVLLSRGGVVLEPCTLHKPTEDAERARIEGGGGWVSESGRVHGVLAVSRAFGDPEVKELAPYVICEPDVRSVPLGDDVEFALVCSDGVTDVISPQAAVTFVKADLRGHRCPQHAAEAIVAEAMKRGSADNATAVVAVFHQLVPEEACAPPWTSVVRTPRVSSTTTQASEAEPAPGQGAEAGAGPGGEDQAAAEAKASAPQGAVRPAVKTEAWADGAVGGGPAATAPPPCGSDAAIGHSKDALVSASFASAGAGAPVSAQSGDDGAGPAPTTVCSEPRQIATEETAGAECAPAPAPLPLAALEAVEL